MNSLSLPAPPSLPVGAWWAIAVGLCALYMATMVRWMPTPSTRYQVAVVPVVAVGVAAGVVLHHGSVSAGLGAASGILLGLPLALVGQHRERARRILDWEANGSRPGELMAPIGVIARYAIIAPGLPMLGWWLG